MKKPHILQEKYKIKNDGPFNFLIIIKNELFYISYLIVIIEAIVLSMKEVNLSFEIINYRTGYIGKAKAILLNLGVRFQALNTCG